MTAEPAEGGWFLTGRKLAVLAAEGTTEVVVVARAGDGMGAFVVPVAEAGLTPVHSLDASRPLVDATLDRVFVPYERALGEPGSTASALGISRALQEATVGLALETVGTCDALFQLLLAYLKERQQFGVAIGSFQAMKHKMSNMFLAIERARSLCYFAVAAINEDTPIRADRRLHGQGRQRRLPGLVGRESIQSFGGIGFTWEHDAISTSSGRPPMVRSSAAPPCTRSPSPPAWASVRAESEAGAMRPGESLIAALDLAPHPEGGWYRRTWVADAEDGTGPPAAPSTTSSWRARSPRRTGWTPPSSGTSTPAIPSSCVGSGPTGGATCRSSGPTSWPGSRPKSSWTPASGNRRARSAATPWSGRR